MFFFFMKQERESIYNRHHNAADKCVLVARYSDERVFD